MKILALPVLLALLCPPLSALDVQVPDALRPSWDRLLAAHPIPEGVEAGAIEVSDTEQPGFRVVEVSTLVPVVPMWEPQPSLRREQIRSGAIRVLPLEQVILPEVAVPVEGLFPGDPGYPLESILSIGIRGDDGRLRRWLESLPSAARPGRIRWIDAVGDLMPARGVDADLRGPAGLQRVFGDTLPVLQGADLLLGNLEAAATSEGAPWKKTYTFRFDPRALASLASAGFGYFSLTNNHTFDFGKAGFIGTLEALDQARIATSGAGADLEEAKRPAELMVGDTRIRVLSFGDYPVDRTGFDGRVTARASGRSPGVLWLDDEGLAAAAAAFDTGAFNIAMVHGGVEWSVVPTAEQRRAYTALVRAGADLVIGSHPHVLQALEAADGKLIAYSLGNFLFPGMEGTPGGQSSVILKVGILGRRIVALQPVPVKLDGRTVRLDTAGDTLHGLQVLSRDLAQGSGSLGG
jgi:hypothetical protein